MYNCWHIKIAGRTPTSNFSLFETEIQTLWSTESFTATPCYLQVSVQKEWHRIGHGAQQTHLELLLCKKCNSMKSHLCILKEERRRESCLTHTEVICPVSAATFHIMRNVHITLWLHVQCARSATSATHNPPESTSKILKTSISVKIIHCIKIIQIK